MCTIFCDFFCDAFFAHNNGQKSHKRKDLPQKREAAISLNQPFTAPSVTPPTMNLERQK